MNRLAVDIETARIDELCGSIPEPEVKLGNLKDPAKIAEKQKEAKDDQVAKMALDPRFSRVMVIGTAVRCGPVIMPEVATIEDTFNSMPPGSADEGERSLLAWFWEKVNDHEGLVTFNGASFDIPFLTWRSLLLGVRCVRIECGKYRCSDGRGQHLDLYQLFQNWEVGGDWGNPLGMKLNQAFYAKQLLKEECPYADQEVDKSDMGAFFKAGRGEFVRKLCEWDVVTTLKLAEAVAPLAM